MNTLIKLGVVIAGYVIACLAAYGVVSVYQGWMQAASAQASAGMYAFGDLLLFLGVCGMLALFPIGLALYFLMRSFRAR